MFAGLKQKAQAATGAGADAADPEPVGEAQEAPKEEGEQKPAF